MQLDFASAALGLELENLASVVVAVLFSSPATWMVASSIALSLSCYARAKCSFSCHSNSPSRICLRMLAWPAPPTLKALPQCWQTTPCRNLGVQTARRIFGHPIGVVLTCRADICRVIAGSAASRALMPVQAQITGSPLGHRTVGTVIRKQKAQAFAHLGQRTCTHDHARGSEPFDNVD